MPSAVYEYVRNIAVFMIFMGFTGAIVPDGKHKKYVNMALSIILTLLMVSPLVTLFGGDFGEIFADFGLDMEKRALAGEYIYNDETQNGIILDAYKANLREQLKRLVAAYNEYEFLDGGFIIGETAEDFGEIYKIWIILSKKTDGSGNSPRGNGGLIRIEPITVGSGRLATPEPAGSDDAIKRLKKGISDFYNIADDNINITS